MSSLINPTYLVNNIESLVQLVIVLYFVSLPFSGVMFVHLFRLWEMVVVGSNFNWCFNPYSEKSDICVSLCSF